MAQINNWDGGLNNRPYAALIDISEGVIHTNIDITCKTLKPLKNDLYLKDLEGTQLYIFKDKDVISNEVRSYVEFKDKLYYSDGIKMPQKSSDGVNWNNISISGPTSAPITTLGEAGTDEITYVGNRDAEDPAVIQYCYTYYNETDDSESAPSSYSDELEVVNNKILISNLKASTDEQVTHIRIYRIGDTLTTMSLVSEIPNTSNNHTDVLTDLQIPGYILETVLATSAPVGLNYLTEYNCMFFGAVGDKLYFTDVARVSYWSEGYMIDFDSEITGIGATSNGLLVFTQFKTYIVFGTEPTVLTNNLVSNTQGCISHSTVKNIYNNLLWVSLNGICLSNGGEINIISKDKLGIIEIRDIKDAIVHNEVYYVSYSNKVLAVDFRYVQPFIFRELSINPTSFAIYNNILYFVEYMKKYQAEAGEGYKSLHYRSGNIAEGRLTAVKNYYNMYCYCYGNLELSMYLNDELICTLPIKNGYNELRPPMINRVAYFLSYEIKGTGHLVELEYNSEGRQNGR